MIRQYTRWLLELKGKLELLRSNLQDLDTLQDLQMSLLNKLKHVETLSRRKNTRTGVRSTRYRYLSKILRHFGDAISTMYISSWNLKQLSFELNSAKMKHSPGFISGKSGLMIEISYLRFLISKGIPAVLCDLTNNIRYGDICLLGDADPFIIECKLSQNKNRRVRRQMSANVSLAAYFKSDRKTIDRGLVEVRRELLGNKVITHLLALNEVLAEAILRGASLRTVEPGLVYAAFSRVHAHPNVSQLFQLKRPWIFCLNEYKNNDGWLSYRSFVDSIRDQETMTKFIHDDVVAFVFIDVSAVKRIASRQGLLFEFIEGDSYPFIFYKMIEHKNIAEYKFGMSIHLITRIALESLSLKWVIEDNHRLFLSTIDKDDKA